MNRFEGKLALVTGGSSGIGYSLAEELVRFGYDVAILARHKDLLDTAVDELTTHVSKEGQKIIPVQADVVKRKELFSILDDFVSQCGTPDIVINSAGVAHPGTFTSLKPEIFDWMMDVNYFGTVNILKRIVPEMQKRRSGTIVNISSIAGFIGLYGYTAYGASKFAVSGFSDALRSELKPYGIQVSVVFPPDTQTPQLEYESKYKPFITRELSGSTKLLTSTSVAKEIIKQVSRKKYLILPGSEGKMLYFMHNLLGGGLYPVMDFLVRNAISKIKMG
jgi:3-dehydrosphinganine reductase